MGIQVMSMKMKHIVRIWAMVVCISCGAFVASSGVYGTPLKMPFYSLHGTLMRVCDYNMKLTSWLRLVFNVYSDFDKLGVVCFLSVKHDL